MQILIWVDHHMSKDTSSSVATPILVATPTSTPPPLQPRLQSHVPQRGEVLSHPTSLTAWDREFVQKNKDEIYELLLVNTYSLKWNPSIAATLGEQNVSRCIGVVFIEGLFCGTWVPGCYTEVAFIQGWPLRGVPLYWDKSVANTVQCYNSSITHNDCMLNVQNFRCSQN